MQSLTQGDDLQRDLDHASSLLASDPAAAVLVVHRMVVRILRACAGGAPDRLEAVRKKAPAVANGIEAVLLAPNLPAQIESAKALLAEVRLRPELFVWGYAEGGPLPTSLPVGGIITPV